MCTTQKNTPVETQFHFNCSWCVHRILKCIGGYEKGQASYSQLLLPEGDSDDEEVIVYESEDWLEKALLKEEQQETQRRRIMSCPT